MDHKCEDCKHYSPIDKPNEGECKEDPEWEKYVNRYDWCRAFDRKEPEYDGGYNTIE